MQVGCAGVSHVAAPSDRPISGRKDFSAVIARAQALPGFSQAACDAWPDKKTVGAGGRGGCGRALP